MCYFDKLGVKQFVPNLFDPNNIIVNRGVARNFYIGRGGGNYTYSYVSHYFINIIYIIIELKKYNISKLK